MYDWRMFAAAAADQRGRLAGSIRADGGHSKGIVLMYIGGSRSSSARRGRLAGDIRADGGVVLAHAGSSLAAQAGWQAGAIRADGGIPMAHAGGK